MRHEKSDIKNWTLPKTLVVSTKISENSKKKIEIINFPMETTFVIQNIKESPLRQEQLSQPVLVIKLFISDLMV